MQLMAKDALAAHARDELGISEMTTARPIQAALTSAATFWSAPPCRCSWSWCRLPACGAGGRVGVLGVPRTSGRDRRQGGRRQRASRHVRVTFWGAFAMALTAGIGALFGTVV